MKQCKRKERHHHIIITSITRTNSNNEGLFVLYFFSNTSLLAGISFVVDMSVLILLSKLIILTAWYYWTSLLSYGEFILAAPLLVTSSMLSTSLYSNFNCSLCNSHFVTPPFSLPSEHHQDRRNSGYDDVLDSTTTIINWLQKSYSNNTPMYWLGSPLLLLRLWKCSHSNSHCKTSTLTPYFT